LKARRGMAGDLVSLFSTARMAASVSDMQKSALLSSLAIGGGGGGGGSV
jgi:hypothetical protein